MEGYLENTRTVNSLKYTLTDETFVLENGLDISQVGVFYQEVAQLLENYPHNTLYIDLYLVNHIDSAGIIALELLKNKLNDRGVETTYSNIPEAIQKKFQVFALKEEVPVPEKTSESFLIRLGEMVYQFFQDFLKKFLMLTADIFYWSLVGLFSSKSQKKGEFYNQAVLIGVNAVPIVAVLAFIIGLVLALQSAAQLRSFGANIYIVDLTVIAMMREMGPLITAILVAGRSGSAIAAEIATMKVTSEIDALTTMALNPIRFVIVPKMHGAIFTMPFLAMLANLMGIIGGMVVANFYLDISPEIFVNRMNETLLVKDVFTGFVKSLFFAGIIVLTGSYYGFNVDKGAEGVGKVTTSAVVVAITLVIVADSIFGLLFY
jgi:phospholipid/cholesterol/gamma-HCH transport system permease protein